MGKATGFKEYSREVPKERPVAQRVKDFAEIYEDFPQENLRRQAARCMDCGVPFCHAGCPLANGIPDWNDFAYRNLWETATTRLLATNNFPEITGRLCPAPCEEACVLGINEQPVTVQQIEKRIIEDAFRRGWVIPRPPKHRTGKNVAIVGSGPAGLAAAQQLNQVGHTVTVFERADKIGGLLRYGIPDFKLEKWVLDRRIELLKKEGVAFKTNASVGTTYPVNKLTDFDAIVLCCGSTVPRDLTIPGREFNGVHFAIDYLRQQNQIVAGKKIKTPINAHGKHVVVIGGGDTGSDCVGTARRQGATAITNFELLPMPPRERPENQPWPFWPTRLRKSSSHEEGCERFFSILTKEFVGGEGHVQAVRTVNVEFHTPHGSNRPHMKEIQGTDCIWRADLVLLAMGFTGVEQDNVINALGVELDAAGRIKTTEPYKTSVDRVFAAGDARRGQSLIVWAIAEGREAARAVDLYLMGASDLPAKGPGGL